jgi:NhaP-type Na+/H+ or K+/H+ antiporter
MPERPRQSSSTTLSMLPLLIDRFHAIYLERTIQLVFPLSGLSMCQHVYGNGLMECDTVLSGRNLPTFRGNLTAAIFLLCVCVCVYIYIYIYTHTHTHTHTRIHWYNVTSYFVWCEIMYLILCEENKLLVSEKGSSRENMLIFGNFRILH